VIYEFSTDYEHPSRTVTDNRFTANSNFDVSALYRKTKFFAAFNAGNILEKHR
jgi:hypothetical protein